LVKGNLSTKTKTRQMEYDELFGATGKCTCTLYVHVSDMVTHMSNSQN
jgi:hypothetical protein